VEAPPAAEAVSINYNSWGDPVDGPAWQAVIDQFHETQDAVQVEMTVAPTDDYYAKLLTQIAGGTPPQCAHFQGWEWQPFADKGVLVPLTDYIERDNFTDPYPDIPGVHQSTERNGHTWIGPYEHPTMVMFYNKAHFDEAGIDYPSPDWTLEDFLEIAAALTDTSGDVKRFGYQANGNWFRDIHWIRNTGAQEFDTLIDPHTAQFNQPEIVEMVQLIASDVYYELKISPTPADLEGGANTIDTGNTSMKYEGPWYFKRLNNEELRAEGKAIDFDVVVMPKVDDPARPHRALTSGIGIVPTDKNDETWEFIRFAVGPEGNATFSSLSGRVPAVKEAAEKAWIPMIEEQFGVTNGQAFLDAFEGAEVDVIGEIPRSKFWNEVVKPVGWDPLTQGTATAAEVLPEVDKQVQAMLDEYWAEKEG
jgi:multiple sugar transport system substrate-binding protein